MSGILIQPSRVFNLLVGVRQGEHASPGVELDLAYLREWSLVQESFSRQRARAKPASNTFSFLNKWMRHFPCKYYIIHSLPLQSKILIKVNHVCFYHDVDWYLGICQALSPVSRKSKHVMIRFWCIFIHVSFEFFESDYTFLSSICYVMLYQLLNVYGLKLHYSFG